MFDYFKSQEYFIDQIWFDHEGIHYTGTGILQWNPETGFHVAANVKRGEIELPFQKEFKAFAFGNSTMMYLRLSGGSHAILPIYFPDELQLLHGHLSENTKGAIFVEPVSIPIRKHWYGSALFELKASIAFPDSVVVETKIGDGQPSQSFSRDGIHYESEVGLRVVGYQKDKKYLQASWSLPVDNWTKTECWEYARGLQYSISALAGQFLELKYREVHRTNRTFREVILNQAPISL